MVVYIYTYITIITYTNRIHPGACGVPHAMGMDLEAGWCVEVYYIRVYHCMLCMAMPVGMGRDDNHEKLVQTFSQVKGRGRQGAST